MTNDDTVNLLKNTKALVQKISPPPNKVIETVLLSTLKVDACVVWFCPLNKVIYGI